jgi:DNA-binding PadR family transcriptional regulator
VRNGRRLIKHGYAMMGEIQEMVGVHLGPGTLYGALVRLERFGLIEAQPSEATRRRPYRLTGLGATSLREYLASMQKIVAIWKKRLASE